MAIRRPRRRFYTPGFSSARYRWWWAQQNKNTIPGAGIFNDAYSWSDSDVWRD